MTKSVYTATARPPFAQVLSPIRIWRDLAKRSELIFAFARREYQAAHRNTFLGIAWTILSPLIMLALFAFVFGYIFKGRFSSSPDETPVDFALALFVGLSIYNCIGAALNQSPSILFANAVYVKTLSFPIEILAVSQLVNLLTALFISLGLCIGAFLIVHGLVHWTVIFLPIHILCVSLVVLGLSWFLSALSVFVPDVPSIVAPISMVLMFLSGVFFSIDSMPPRVKFIFQLNPLASLIYQARGAVLYGSVPNFVTMGITLFLSVVICIAGYAFFSRSKATFADLL
jgi:lipopolysaccharide transport system permease protein